MKSQRCKVSDDPQTTHGRSSRLSADEQLLNIPMDLIVDIFLRLPRKVVARCRCVSKRWASVLRGPDFTELFLSKSLAHPQLLFARKEESEVIFFSSPQPQNPDENNLSTIAADHHMSFPIGPFCDISSPVNGYVCISHDPQILNGRNIPEIAYAICNPSTRQCFTLPRFKKGEIICMRSLLGYDPVEKQHKVLARILKHNGAQEHHVLTLRGNNGNMTWRLIECGMQHSFPRRECICINGVLYYIAKASNYDDYMIVCFDVRSEKFSFVKAFTCKLTLATLVNYKGKLASLMPQPDNLYFISQASTSFEMWILEDPEKHEWSNHVFKLPPMWKDVVAGKDLFFKGVTATNEIILSPNSSSGFYHVYYYNFDKETITRVEIEGLGAFDRNSRVYTFINHVEDLKLM